MAGNDQDFVDITLSTTLAANTPEQGTGLWTVESGDGGSFDGDSLPDATFTGQPCTVHTLTWTISNTFNSNSDFVNISFFVTPTAANAGNDTIVKAGGTSLTLYANTSEMDDGFRSVVSG